MKRVGEQQERTRQARLVRRQHARLTAAVGVATEADARRTGAREGQDSGAEPGAVACGACRRRRPVRPGLPEGQVAAEHRDAPGDQGVCERDQKRARRGGSGAVREDEAELGAAGRNVERAPDDEPLADVLVKRRRWRRRGVARAHGRAPAACRPTPAATRGIE